MRVRESVVVREEKLLRLAEQYGVLDDPEIRKLVLAAGVSNNDLVQKVASKAVVGKSVRRWRYPFNPQRRSGEIRVGESFQGRRFRFSESDLTKHLLAVGQSGSGKTTLFYGLMDELEKPFWSFDLKQDYRHLTGKEDVLVLPWTEFRFNPLRPPEGVSPRRWAQVFAEMFGHSTALLSGSKNYLMKKVVRLYQLYNLFDEVSPPYPSLHELELLIRKGEEVNYVRKESDYRDTVLNRLEAMNLVAGTVFDGSQGYGVEELLDRDTVFEFDGLSRDVQNFLMEILFAAVYEYRLAKGDRDQGLNHVFFLDEGKRVFSVYKERQDASGIPEIDELTAKMREFGEGLVVGDQEASKLTDSIKANTYTKLLLSTGDQKQFSNVADSLNLSQRQRKFAQSLDVGEAVVQVGDNDPVPVKLRNYSLEKTVSDRELEKSQAENWSQLQHTARETTPEFESVVAPGRSDEAPEAEIPDDPEEVDVSNEADRLLEDVVENPFKPLTERYQRFSSRYKGNKAKNELVDAGTVVERHVRSQRGKRKLLQLTEKGRDYVEDHLDLDSKQRGRGGIMHRYWQHRIMEAFEEAGWTAELEVFDADVYVNMGNTELVVEVAMGDNPREIQHVEKHLERFDTVWITTRNQEILEGLKERVEENGSDQDRVVFRLVRDFNGLEEISW
jgi:DNA-binding MarR family transcriptional regulator